MNRLLWYALFALPSVAWSGPGGELIGPVFQGVFYALFLLIVGCWSLSSLIEMKRWLLALASLVFGAIGWQAYGREGSATFTFLQWLLTSAIVLRVCVALERAIAEDRNK